MTDTTGGAEGEGEFAEIFATVLNRAVREAT